jgi:hypothetical protein
MAARPTRLRIKPFLQPAAAKIISTAAITTSIITDMFKKDHPLSYGKMPNRQGKNRQA